MLFVDMVLVNGINHLKVKVDQKLSKESETPLHPACSCRFKTPWQPPLGTPDVIHLRGVGEGLTRRQGLGAPCGGSFGEKGTC